MSMHISFVAIEGEHLNEIPEMLTAFDYSVTESKAVENAAELVHAFSTSAAEDVLTKIAYTNGNWTVLVDPEMVVMHQDELADYSQKWKARVVGIVMEGTSGSYGFRVFALGEQQRLVMAIDGAVVVNEGAPLPEEEGIDWTRVFESECLTLAERFGIAFDLTVDRTYHIFQLASE